MVSVTSLEHPAETADSESEVWMMTGLAVRMSIDAGLHIVGLDSCVPWAY